MTYIIDKFSINNEKEEFSAIYTNIDNGVVFRGTNLWVLIFAIFVASLGLNVNSTAVILGAMLISPLMGPIMGIGLGVGIYDSGLVRKAVYNFIIATVAALTTSTVFFLMSPLNEAHSELLARTSPTIYDVLIALFGGFAGMVATSSKQKGNVIPGVAIATALMPPLCTAGYGLATLQFEFFFGAFYLFVINTVFIALATFIIVRLLNFPRKQMVNTKEENITKSIVWGVVVITLLPSIYFGIEMVRQNRFIKNTTHFITNEAQFHNNYLLSKKVNGKDRSMVLVYGGKGIDSAEIMRVKSKMKQYNLENASLEIKQGFAYLPEEKNGDQNAQFSQLTLALTEKEKQLKSMQAPLDSIVFQGKLSAQVFAELKTQYPALQNAIIQPALILTDSSNTKLSYLVLLSFPKSLQVNDKKKIENWLKVRLNQESVKLVIQ